MPVSIHAPARGATRGRSGCRWRGCFNPRPRAGGDERLLRPPVKPWKPFQSTPPRGGRPHSCDCPHVEDGFNPRPRAGGDAGLESDSEEPYVSIHAPARGATGISPNKSDMEQTFQSTPPRGGRPQADAEALRDARRFNPRPRAGGDSCRSRHRRPWNRFQSTPPRGGRPERDVRRAGRDRVSIHAPARGAT